MILNTEAEGERATGNMHTHLGQGHIHACACRIVYGDGECECRLKERQQADMPCPPRGTLQATQKEYKILENTLTDILNNLEAIAHPKVEYREETSQMANEAIQEMQKRAFVILEIIKTNVLANKNRIKI